MIPKESSMMSWDHGNIFHHTVSLYCECREEEVHVLGFEASEEELKDGLKTPHTQR